MSMARFTPGALFRISVKDDHAYALMLASPGYVAFYGADVDFTEEGGPAGPPLFVVIVTDPTYSGRKLGKPMRIVPAGEFPPIPKFFRQSATGGECRIINRDAGQIVSAWPKDCIGLEQEAAWAADHIESRILDAYAGRPNLFAEALKSRLPGNQPYR